MKNILKDQFDKLPISRLVIQEIQEEDLVERDTSRFIDIKEFRTSAFFPVLFYKNISRDIPLTKNENY